MSRCGDYKNSGKGMETLRAKRVEITVELRKARREDRLSKRRNLVILEDGSNLMSDDEPNSTDWSSYQVVQILQQFRSNDPQIQLNACTFVRKLLSREKHPPISLAIKNGLVPYFVEFLRAFDCPKLQFEAAWALTNIASGNAAETKEVTKAGAVPLLIALLKSPASNVVEQAVWALGNISGDGPQNRDLILEANGMPALIDLLNIKMPVTFLRNLVWTISNLCRNKNPPPPFDKISICLPSLHSLLFAQDSEVLGDALWALSYMTDGPNDKIQAVVDHGLVPQVIKHLSSASMIVLVPALRTIGNIVTGSDVQTDVVIREGALTELRQLMRHASVNIVKESTWAVSNILAGNVLQIQAAINAGVLSHLLHVLSKADFKSMKEAGWAVTNLTSGGNEAQVAVLIRMNFVPPMCDLLNSPDTKMALIIMEGISNILATAEKLGMVEQVALQIEECGGLDKIETLQVHSNPEIYHKAISIIEKYFSGDDQVFHDPSEPNAFLSLSEFQEQNNQRFDF